MGPLNLSKGPPRATRDVLAGIVFLPRSIDKIRASLPGGSMNGYTIEGGLTGEMLEYLGIPLEDLRAVVAHAHSDADVAEYVLAHTNPSSVDAWNNYILGRELYQGDRAKAIAAFPWLVDHPGLTRSLDFLQYLEDHGLDG